ncbi:MAG: hypothetical protein ACE14T_10735 [Syntrophales bacterium]
MMIRIILAFIILYLLYRFLRKTIFPLQKNRRSVSENPFQSSGEELVEDPYCHTYVPISDAYRLETGGRKLFFCSRECLEKYKKERS